MPELKKVVLRMSNCEKVEINKEAILDLRLKNIQTEKTYLRGRYSTEEICKEFTILLSHKEDNHEGYLIGDGTTHNRLSYRDLVSVDIVTEEGIESFWLESEEECGENIYQEIYENKVGDLYITVTAGEKEIPIDKLEDNEYMEFFYYGGGK